MGFGFRKSVGLGGGIRMTASKSGISMSAGGKGYRVTTGPKGTYVTIGAKGIYYRQQIGGRISTSSVPRSVPTNSPQPPQPMQPITAYSAGTPIVTADAGQLVELSSAATLEQLNTVSQQPAYAWMFLAGGAIVAFLLAQIHVVLFFLVMGLFAYLAYIANNLDKDRRTFCLNYDLDAQAQQKWNLLGQAVSMLGRSQKVWRMNTQDYTSDQRRNAGASSLVTRAVAGFSQQVPSTVGSNITPHRLDLGDQVLFFFPDRLYVYSNKTYGAVEYSSLQVGFDTTRFIEEQGVPSDATVVGQTWRFVNKNGTPDRRFNNNYQIPIAQYAQVALRSTTGMNLLLQASSVQSAGQFAELFRSYQEFDKPQAQRQSPPRSSTASHQNNAQEQSSSGARQRRTASRPSTTPKVRDCYDVLGLSPTCTKEEMTAKYRQMVKDYHPDRVSHMAPEFQQLATQKLQEINTAVEEVKRLNGW